MLESDHEHDEGDLLDIMRRKKATGDVK